MLPVFFGIIIFKQFVPKLSLEIEMGLKDWEFYKLVKNI